MPNCFDALHMQSDKSQYTKDDAGAAHLTPAHLAPCRANLEGNACPASLQRVMAQARRTLCIVNPRSNAYPCGDKTLTQTHLTGLQARAISCRKRPSVPESCQISRSAQLSDTASKYGPQISQNHLNPFDGFCSAQVVKAVPASFFLKYTVRLGAVRDKLRDSAGC